MRPLGGMALVVALGCASRGQSKETHATNTAVADAGPSSPFATLNLGFEELDGARPRGWSTKSTEYTIDADGVAHGGARSLRITAAPDAKSFGPSASHVDAVPLRGRRLVLHGWIKTADVSGWAGLWLRADPDGVAFANSEARGVKGTTEWTEREVAIDVPEEATTIVFGTLLAGTGRGWFDDLRLEVIDLRRNEPVTLTGRVEDASGKPLADAVVGLVPVGGSITTWTRSDAAGRFRLQAKAGRWAVSAQHPAGVGAFTELREVQPPGVDDLVLRLGAGGGVTVRGTISVEGPPLEGATLTIAPVSEHESDAFLVPVEASGAFRAILPRGTEYMVRFGGTLQRGGGTLTAKGDVAEGTLTSVRAEPPPAAVVDWLKATAIPVTTVEAGHGFADLAPLAAVVGDARIVALGEATHGSREIFQMKHRLLEYLVSELGFTVFAIEANQPECRAINAYVVDGVGDARQALAGIYFWTWNTEEVLAMIEWMRAWNADPAHRRKLKFTGFDMQTATVARANVQTYLARVGGGDPPPMEREALAQLARRMDASAARWSKVTGRAAFDDARHDLRVLEQNVELSSEKASGASSVRDASMAENVEWLLAHEPPGTRMVLWAHNGHIALEQPGSWVQMGSLLRKRFGRDYLAAGFVFAQGGFQAIDRRSVGGRLGPVTLGPPPETDVSTAFARTGHPLLIADLRRLPDGEVARWLGAPRPMRETGAVFFDEESMTSPAILPRRFDVAIFIRDTTRARPLARR